MKLSVVLAVLIGILLFAYSSAVPAPAEPTPNIDATVEAPAKQLVAAQATPTPYPTYAQSLRGRHLKDTGDTKNGILIPKNKPSDIQPEGFFVPRSWCARRDSNSQPLGSKANGMHTPWYPVVHYASEWSDNQASMRSRCLVWYRLVWSSSLTKVLADPPTESRLQTPTKEPYPGGVL